MVVPKGLTTKGTKPPPEAEAPKDAPISQNEVKIDLSTDEDREKTFDQLRDLLSTNPDLVKKQLAQMAKADRDAFKHKIMTENVASIGLDCGSTFGDADPAPVIGIYWGAFNATGYFQIVFATISITMVPTFVMGTGWSGSGHMMWSAAQFITAVLGFVNARRRQYELAVVYVALCYWQLKYAWRRLHHIAALRDEEGLHHSGAWNLIVVFALVGTAVTCAAAILVAVFGTARLLTKHEKKMREEEQKDEEEEEDAEENSEAETKEESVNEAAETEAQENPNEEHPPEEKPAEDQTRRHTVD